MSHLSITPVYNTADQGIMCNYEKYISMVVFIVLGLTISERCIAITKICAKIGGGITLSVDYTT